MPTIKSSERGTLPIETFADRFVTTLLDPPQGDQNHDNCERKIDEEDPAPGCIFHQPSAQDWPDGCSDRREAGPASDGSPALVFCIGGADDG